MFNHSSTSNATTGANSNLGTNNAVNPNGTLGGSISVNPGTGANFPNFPVTTPDGRNPFVTNNVTPGATPVNPVGPAATNAALNYGVNEALLTGQTQPLSTALSPNAQNNASGVGGANQTLLDRNIAAPGSTQGSGVGTANIQAGFNQQNNGNVQNNTAAQASQGLTNTPNTGLNNGAYNPNTRMQFYSNAWWYLQPNNQWMLYRNNAWVPYTGPANTAQPNGGPAATIPTTSGATPPANPMNSTANPATNPPAAPAPVSGTPGGQTSVDSSGVISGP